MFLRSSLHDLSWKNTFENGCVKNFIVIHLLMIHSLGIRSSVRAIGSDGYVACEGYHECKVCTYHMGLQPHFFYQKLILGVRYAIGLL